jgi:UDP-glucose 4-epimerase
MKILVTGGAGFIGSHVAEAYLGAGHDVAVLDDLSAGRRSNVPKGARFYKADIKDRKTIEKILKKEQPDILNHHAALVSVTGSVAKPFLSLETNLTGTVQLLRAFSEHGRGVKKFIFASTGGALYGGKAVIPAKEDSPIEPISPYGFTKHLAEEAVRFYARTLGFPYLIFRYANVYGPRQNPKGEGGVVAIWGSLMKQKKTPVVFGDGKKTRDYVYVGDVARANLLALKRGSNTELHIGTRKETKDIELFLKMKEISGYPGKPKFMKARPGEIIRSAVDPSKAKRTLGWQPETALSEGLRRTIESLTTPA